MEHKKIINLLDDTTNQPFKCWTRNWFEINDEWKGKYDSSKIRFKTSIIRSNLCDYSDADILVKGTITVPNAVATGVAVNHTSENVIFKICAPFNDCIPKTSNIQVNDVQKTDIVGTVMLMYNLIVMLVWRNQEVYDNPIEMN